MSTKVISRVSPVERRIRQFYGHLNEGCFARCYLMVDPLVRHSPSSVTLYKYLQSLGAFRDHFGQVVVQRVEVQLHLDEPNKRFQDRDFAVGKTTWKDQQGEEHVFQERWVRNGRYWYTVCTGFVTPDDRKLDPADVAARSAGR